MTTINVTWDDIEHGRQGSSMSCPIARAVGTALNDRVSVGRDRLSTMRTYKVAYLPPEARTFISEFDAGRPVSPFTFEIELIPTINKVN
jgi:hypothetical protein